MPFIKTINTEVMSSHATCEQATKLLIALNMHPYSLYTSWRSTSFFSGDDIYHSQAKRRRTQTPHPELAHSCIHSQKITLSSPVLRPTIMRHSLRIFKYVCRASSFFFLDRRSHTRFMSSKNRISGWCRPRRACYAIAHASQKNE